MVQIDSNFVEHGYGTRFQGFQNLMRQRIRDILLVSSLYDLYLFEEDGRLYELIRNEYQDLQLSHSPELTRVSGGNEALALLKEKRFDLVITTLHIEDMHPINFAKQIRTETKEMPVVLLSFDNRELNELLLNSESAVFDKIFIWQGDFKLIIAIIKYLEDRMNVDHDSKIVGVQSIILVEDNIRFYSSYLPILYTEIIKQSKRLISEGINLSHRYLRMRARPKILLCSTYEEAWSYFESYQEHILGIISDIDFIRGGAPDHKAGIMLTKEARKRHPDIPVLLQSHEASHEQEARESGASLFVLKNSSTLSLELREFMTQFFSFGDFIFRFPDGTEVSRASDLRSLEEQLLHIPDDSIRFHAERNHFSNWFKARTEFWLADRLRTKKISDYPDITAVKQDLINSLREYRKLRQRGLITDFNKESFDPKNGFARIGNGSLGGKARGLGFLNILINNYGIRDVFPGIQIAVPPAVVLGTDVFDQFLDENNLRTFSLQCTDDAALTSAFIAAQKFPKEAAEQLISFLELIREPLAVRSSSLLEDSQYHPFAGVYETFMIPNNYEDPIERARHLIHTIKLVYASTFSCAAKNYIRATSYRLEEEKMAVIVQKMLGTQHGDRFYPDFSGVAKSYNFYPLAPQTSKDGIVSAALGLGKYIVEGGLSVRFAPKYPNHIVQFHSVDETLSNHQKEFYALEFAKEESVSHSSDDLFTKKYALSAAEKDGTLNIVASTYSHENNAIYDGISRAGYRLVTFAPILKHKVFPLPKILELLLDMGSWGMGTQVEIEFAVNYSVPAGAVKEFGVLQMRPLVVSNETELIEIESVDKKDVFCMSDQVLGNGLLNDLKDIIVVAVNTFDRSKSREVAAEVSQFNAKLTAENTPYLLVGVGRWGTLDPWLGIPVIWSQISGARCIIESQMKDMAVAPSQGSHFFHNLTSFMVGYFTVNPYANQGYIDWDWLLSLPAKEEKQFVRHIRFSKPLEIKMNARQKAGIIFKPKE